MQVKHFLKKIISLMWSNLSSNIYGRNLQSEVDGVTEFTTASEGMNGYNCYNASDNRNSLVKDVPQTKTIEMIVAVV